MGIKTGQETPACRLTTSERSPEVLERDLLLAFVMMTTIFMLSHLGGPLHRLWISCASQLQAAVLQALQ